MERNLTVWRRRIAPIRGVLIVSAALVAGPACAQVSSADAPASATDAAATTSGVADAVGDYFAHWFDRVHAAQASQPHWITPIATVTPRLEEEFRYDQFWQSQSNGARLDISDGGKGLELIPTTSTELLFNLPPYQDRTVKKAASGFNDWPFLVIKQRLISANEDNGDYIVSAFFGVQAPTGISAFTNHAWVITPTLAAGKGWGNLDIQGTIGVPIPLSDERVIGTSVVSNVTLQYHLGEVFWPELEFNTTYWADGQRAGKTQVFLTPGFVLGRFPLGAGLKGIIGLGYQVAISPMLTRTPVLTPTYNHAWILSTRLAF